MPRGGEIVRLGDTWREGGYYKLSLLEYCEHYGLTPIPARRWCTQKWKTDPIDRFAQTSNIETQLVGIAADEAHRQKGRVCPLIDRGITRKGCIEIIESEGLSVPQKSGCYICPFQRKSQWRELYRRHPELYAKVSHLEVLSLQRRGCQTSLVVGGDFTLAELAAQIEQQTTFFDDNEMDELLQYKPCVCGL